MMKMSKDDIEKLNEVIETIIEAVEYNARLYQELTEGDSHLSLQGHEPLKEAYVEEDKVEIAVQSKDEFSSIGVGQNDGILVLNVGGEDMRFDVPEDVKLDDMEAKFNNGVLSVTIPRGE